MNCAIVTGASRGIGKSIALKLASDGYHILLNYRSNDVEAQKTRDEIIAAGTTCELLKFDVASKEQAELVLGGWMENNTDKTIEILVNNAGIRDDALMMWMTDKQWNGVIDTNLTSFFYITRLVLSHMLVKRYGRIVNIVSLSGLKGLPGQVNYSAAKAGIIGATKALAQEVARRGVTVNAIAPGFVKTDMTKDLNEKELAELVPMKRFGNPDEVADLVSFISSKKASYITGQVISINGGLY
jgi:3-oxoacyl-[acyl-carrier protein] reductase